MIGTRRKEDLVAIRIALETRGRVSLRVYGSSMLPWIRPRDILVIRGTKPSRVECGDVVLFARGERMFVHRVIEKRSNGTAVLVTKGDAQPHRDSPISADELLGRVSSLHRGWHCVNFESGPHGVVKRFLFRISAASECWYPLARRVWSFCLPLYQALE